MQIKVHDQRGDLFHMKKKEIQFRKVLYQRNIDLGIDSECHECTSHHRKAGGHIEWKRDGFSRLHRWVYWKHTGEIPEVVMHLCDNPACININHLKAGTHEINAFDRVKKKRGNASLDEDKVRYIKYWIRIGYTDLEISKSFEVDRRTIRDIRINKTWKRVLI